MYYHDSKSFSSQLDADFKEVWFAERDLLNILDDTQADIIAFLQQCDSADLHQFDTVHGLPQELAVFRAILNHPKCDRATALNIFLACDPDHFDACLRNGLRFQDFEDPEEQVQFQILVEAYAKLSARESWRGRFTVTNADYFADAPEKHPTRYTHFKLSSAVMRPCQNRPAHSAITYDYPVIALSYEAWLAKQ